MREGDVVLAAIPQADRQNKHRPAFSREMPAPFRDVLICGVSTQTHRRVEDFDEVLSTMDADFGSSGLLASSLIRLGFLYRVAAYEHRRRHRFDLTGAPPAPPRKARRLPHSLKLV